ncbi:MAG: 5-formyltetrahydrofolate cyclo-ligase [Alphaproteobacteria bacterium]
MTSTKAQLRTQARKHRAALDPLAEDPQAACDLFFETIAPTPNQIISAYWPVKDEFDPTPVLERALKDGIKCALPVIKADSRILEFRLWDEATKMQSNIFGIPEPAEGEPCLPDIIISPLLAFDTTGNRLGQGGGYYDATLEHLRAQKEITAIGMAFSTQAVLFKLPSEEHDEPLDMVITPKGVHRF